MTPELFDKYPLVKKAFDQQDAVYAADGGMPEKIKKIRARSVELVEQFVNRPQAEKEGLMVAAALMADVQFFFRNANSFLSGYSAETQTAIGELELLRHTHVFSTNAAQALTVHTMAKMEEDTAALIEDGLPYSRDAARKKIATVAAFDPRMMETLESPTLKAAFEATSLALIDAIKTELDKPQRPQGRPATPVLPEELAAKYPEVEAAFVQQDRYFAGTEGATPEAVKAQRLRVAEIIDATVDMPAGQKAGLIIASLLMTSQEFAEDAGLSFQKEYGPAVAAVVKDVTENTFVDKNAMGLSAALAYAAISVSSLEGVTAEIKSGALKLPEGYGEQGRAKTAEIDAMVAPALGNSKLGALVKNTGSEFIKAVDAAAPAKKAPKKKAPKTPRPKN